ncbi:major facilitator superfamily transporter [Pseudomassariella vexata]|uniref:Major facilitator superfamily transporter n=1 Tax=Pseudomassariella vexata TaxID=1141098 RepID=A0A1Y2DKE8_9PEZI|nr:major facilitator superfamily transporter [Pseudomassariella vexata]ORY59659.1 major facilitator superfamily transporter [Pseudomassariella vexata]
MEAGASTQMTDWSPTNHQLLIMITLSIISLMVALDACIIVTSLSAIVIDMNGNTTQGFWVGTSYLLANAVMMPFIAAISDIFGRPICLIASLICFTIGTLLCCLAHSIGILLAGRSLQGVGGGGIIVLSLVIFTDIVPLRVRPKWYGTVLGAWALGNCLGPILGGVIVEHTTWRWIFYIMFPFCAFGLISIPCLLTLQPRTATLGEKLARVDWLGGLLFISSATSFLIAISWGGSQFDWNSAATLVPLCLGVAGLAAAFVYEACVAKQPFLRRSLFWRLSSTATYFCGSMQGLVIYGQLYYGPFYFLSVKGFRPVHTGIALFPVMFTLVPGSIVTGAIVTRCNNYRWAIWIGWTLTAIASGLMILWDVDTPTAQWAITMIILGFGHGAILNAQNFAAQAMCRPGEEGSAAAMYGFVRQFGTALGVGIGGSTFQNVMATKLSSEGLPKSIAHNSEAFVPILVTLSDDSTEKKAILDAYVSGFRGVYGVYVAIAGIAFFISLFIKHHDMNKVIDTEHKLQETRVSRLFDGRSSGTPPSPERLSDSNMAERRSCGP